MNRKLRMAGLAAAAVGAGEDIAPTIGNGRVFTTSFKNETPE